MKGQDQSPVRLIEARDSSIKRHNTLVDLIGGFRAAPGLMGPYWNEQPEARIAARKFFRLASEAAQRRPGLPRRFETGEQAHGQSAAPKALGEGPKP